MHADTTNHLLSTLRREIAIKGTCHMAREKKPLSSRAHHPDSDRHENEPTRPGRPAGPSGVIHTVDVLRAIGAESLLGVNEIARRVKLHKSSVSRILSGLEEARFVERDTVTNRFRLGTGLISLAGRLLASLSVIDVARPFLQEVATSTGETTNLSIWNNGEVLVVDQVIGPAPIKHITTPGNSPVHCTASGKALLAYASPEMIQQTRMRGFPRLTTNTITDWNTLSKELDEVRRRGYAINDEELMPEVSAVASVVRDHRGDVVASFSVALPKYRFLKGRQSELTEKITNVAMEISLRMGYTKS
jgi:DNA-binding IclR family transcriptional regulator